MIDYSIIIDCPDTYLDILQVFFDFLNKNWKTRKNTIYITTQNKSIDCPENVVFVRCGVGSNSIQRSKKAIKLIKDKYVLILDCDDFIGKTVKDNEIQNLLLYAEKNNIRYLRVWKTKNREQRRYKTEFKHLYFCNKKARYSKSLMANFWNKDEYLKVFENDNFDGWSVEEEWLKQSHFEEKGFYNHYCYYDNDPFGIIHAVSKGKWIRKAYRACLSFGIPVDFLSKRERQSKKEAVKHQLSDFIFNHFSSNFCYKIKKITKRNIKYTSEY